jgi:hypothetical protein
MGKVSHYVIPLSHGDPLVRLVYVSLNVPYCVSHPMVHNNVISHLRNRLFLSYPSTLESSCASKYKTSRPSIMLYDIQ